MPTAASRPTEGASPSAPAPAEAASPTPPAASEVEAAVSAKEPSVTPPPIPTAPAEPPLSLEELFEEGRAWLEDHFGGEDSAELPVGELRQLGGALQALAAALASGRIDDIAAARAQARQVLEWLQRQPWGSPYADWLKPRMDFFDVADEAVAAGRRQWADERSRQQRPSEANGEGRPTLRFEVVRDRVFRSLMNRRSWERRISQRQPPPLAAQWVPSLKEVFRAQGIPVEMVWLAEVESAFDAAARSPVGARGLFQLMPATAVRFGLQILPFDERIDPEKNARAAAQYLRALHGQFGDWPLALAAYNAGEGRIARELGRSSTRSFDAIADRLPAETRLYVPKVLATVAAREGVDPFALPAPAPRSAPAGAGSRAPVAAGAAP